MWRNWKIVVLAVPCTLLALFASGRQEQHEHPQLKPRHPVAALPYHGTHKPRDAEIKAVLQAVQDEIYDYGYEKEYYEIGYNVGTSMHWISRVPIYINPQVKDGVGQTIYKVMPYGEVFRMFDIGDDGLVGLIGNPQSGFPLTQPSHRTIYDDDDGLAQMRLAWIRRTFDVDDSPTAEMRQGAIKRQKLRNRGFSDWEYLHSSGRKKADK
jgi:hypothetical protein